MKKQSDSIEVFVVDQLSTSAGPQGAVTRTLADAAPHGEESAEEIAGPGELLPLLTRGVVASAPVGVVVGTLIGIKDEGRTPLVAYPGMIANAPAAARAVVDLHASHVGKRVVMLFEGGELSKPIVMGVVREDDTWPLTNRPGVVEIAADGERVVVTAKEQLVLRCGRASITLTKAGKVLIEGAYVSTRASGVNRLKGGVVQIN